MSSLPESILLLLLSRSMLALSELLVFGFSVAGGEPPRLGVHQGTRDRRAEEYATRKRFQRECGNLKFAAQPTAAAAAVALLPSRRPPSTEGAVATGSGQGDHACNIFGV